MNKLEAFSKDILKADIPLFTLKTILHLLSSNLDSINVSELCAMMFINKKKLTNEFAKLKPINGYLEIEMEGEDYCLYVNGDKYKILADIKKKKTKKETTIKKEKKLSEHESNVQRIFLYWCKLMGKTNRTTLDSSRRRIINSALQQLSLEECELAILGCSKSLWHMGITSPNNKKYNTLELIFRNLDKAENFIENAKSASLAEQKIIEDGSRPKKIEERLNDNDWFKQRADLPIKNQTVLENKKNIKTKKEVPLLDFVESDKPYNVEALALKSEIVMGFKKEIEEIEYTEIIEHNNTGGESGTKEEIPFYLQVLKNKNKEI